VSGESLRDVKNQPRNPGIGGGCGSCDPHGPSKAKLDICKSREKAGKDPDPLSDDEKVNIGRVIHIQDAGGGVTKRKHRRAGHRPANQARGGLLAS